MPVQTPRPSMAQERLYCITPAGHDALSDPETCLCNWVVSMGMYVCTKCGTGVRAVRPGASSPRGDKS